MTKMIRKKIRKPPREGPLSLHTVNSELGLVMCVYFAPTVHIVLIRRVCIYHLYKLGVIKNFIEQFSFKE